MVSEIVVEKKKLRELIRNKLKNLTSTEYNELNNKVSNNLFTFLNNQKVIQEKVQLGVYAPFEREPVWYQTIEVDQLNLSFPAQGNDLNQMCFRATKWNELIEKNDFGSKILGPKENCEEVVPSILLIPGIAFNLKGERLGRGKGYFDRYLEGFRGLKVGIAFEIQLSEKIPTDKNDQKLDWLITEKNIYKIEV